jgi:hypothetical protein
MRIPYFVLALQLLPPGLSAAQHPVMPPGISHDEHLRQLQKDEDLKRRGALAMGFDQDKVAHHFLLQRSGGSIVVTARNAADSESVTQIQIHLRQIAEGFAAGVFDKPIETHAEQPAGAEAMAAHRRLITYTYRERSDGGEVAIATSDPTTLAAIHEFLRYQIVEHQTGDPLAPPPEADVIRPAAAIGPARMFQKVCARAR